MSEESYPSGLSTEECVSHGQVHLWEPEHIHYSWVFFKVWNQGINLDYFFGTFHCLSFFSYICSQSLHLSGCSVAQACLTLRDPTDCSTPCLSLIISRSLPKFMSIALVMASSHLILWIALVIASSHLILWHPLLLTSIFPSIRVFSNEWALHIRWPKYWSFSVSISPSNECSGLISFKIDWFDLLQFKGPSRVFSSTTVQRH